jgi:hypothetical protein
MKMKTLHEIHNERINSLPQSLRAGKSRTDSRKEFIHRLFGAQCRVRTHQTSRYKFRPQSAQYFTIKRQTIG